MTSDDTAEWTMATATEPDDFTDVFQRDSGSDRERGAEPAAPVEGQPNRDERGRYAAQSSESSAQPETKPEVPAPVQATTTSQQQSEAEPARQPRQVPLPELMAEREKRQSEARLREEAERRAHALEQRTRELETLFRQQQQQQQAPDPWSDPKGALEWQQQQMAEKLQQQHQHFQNQIMLERSNVSEVLARQKWGDEAVNAAEQAAIDAGYAGHFLQQRDPYGSLMKWHRQASFVQKVGDDPDAYEKAIEKRAYEKALADLRSGKAPGAAPQRFPGSLADATASGSQGAVLTDEAIANELFDTNRNRRQA